MRMGVRRIWQKSIKKNSWNHFDGANEEDAEDTDVANDAGKCKGRKAA